MELTVFENSEFGLVRATSINGEPWIVAKDAADILGYSNSRDALARHVDSEDKSYVVIHDGSQDRNMTVINESGLYSLIFGSKLPRAREFKHWVTSEVLPSIRKNGGYIAGQEALTDDQLLEKALLVAKRHIEERDKRIAKMRPKEIFADAVSASDTSILIGDLAKLIKQNGRDIGQNRLFQWLRDQGYLIKGGSNKNMPTQKAMDLGLFEVKERTINNPDGSIRITRTTKVTGKGQVYFINKLVAS